MTRIDPGDVARRAEELRRRAEEQQRTQQRPAAPSPPPEPPQPARPAPADVVEKVPRLFGREIPMDFPLPPGMPIEAPPADLAPPPVVTPPEPEPPAGPRTDVLPRMPSPTVQARLDAELDRQELAAVLGGVASPAVAATGLEPGLAGTARPLVGVKRLAWAQKAPGLLKGRLAKLAERAGSLEGRAVKIKDLLAASESRNARAVVGFDMAAGSLEKAAWKAGIARELSRLAPGDPAVSLDRMTAARQQFVDVQAYAGEAETALRELAPTSSETPWALQEVRALQQEAGGARWETAQTEATGELLAEMDAGQGYLTEAAPEAAGEEAAPAAEFEFGEADLARIGTALDPTRPPPQANWSDHMINTVCELGRQQGGITDEQGGRNLELARTVLAADDAPGPKELGAADLAAVLKMSGVDLAKVDAPQLQAASSYVSKATTLEDQLQRLRKSLDTFQVLEKTGLPKFSRAQMIDELWNVAKVPADALKKLKDTELTQKFQEVLATVNAGPGQSEIKIGKHKLKITVGADGTVKKSSCKKPGFFSKVWSAVKVVTPIALTVLSFIPVTAPFAMAAQGAISLVQAIKNKSLLGIATAAASMVGGVGGVVSKVAGGLNKVATTAQRVASIANNVGRGLQGVSSIKSGNIVGGLANIGGAFANGIAGFAANGATRLGRVADTLNKVSSKMSAAGAAISSIDGYRKASQALSQAKEALETAQASGNPRAIADAQKRLSQAENQKRGALIGGAAGAMTAVSAWTDNRSLFAGESKQIPPATQRLQFNARLASQALGVAQGVASKDFAAAAVSALSVTATLKNAPQEKGAPPRGQSAHRFNEAANMAQAGLGYYQAEKGRNAANAAVTDARSRLDAAKRTGGPEAIRQAEAALKEARAGAESALMGGIAAGESLLATARDIGAQHQSRVEASRLEKSAEAAQKERANLATQSLDPKQPDTLRKAADKGLEALDKAGAEYREAVIAAGGDGEKLKAAREKFEEDRAAVAQEMAKATAAVSTATTRPVDSPTAPAAAPPGLASLRRPSRIDAYKITPNLTIWEVSQATGVPEDRIREFNAQNGNPLKDTKLPIDGQIFVPMDPEDVKFPPKTHTEIRAMQREAIAARRAATGSGATGNLSAKDAAPFGQIQQQFKDGKWQEGAASLAGLVMQGTPEQKALARQLLGQIEQEQLRNVHLVNNGKIQQINEAVNPSNQGLVAGAVDAVGTLLKDAASMYLGQGQHSENVRTIGNERMATIHDQDMAISAVQQIYRQTGMTLYELGRVPPSEMDATLQKVYPGLGRHEILALRGSVTKALANPDVGAISRANYGSFSWDRGLTQADTSFADSILQTTAKAVGSTVRQAYSDAAVAKNSSSWVDRAIGHYSTTVLDAVSTTNHFLTSTVEAAKTYYATQGGVTGKVGGALTTVGDLLLTPVTAPLTIADHRATDDARTRGLVDTALFVAGGSLIKAAAPSLTRGLSSAMKRIEGGALGETAAGGAKWAASAATRAGQVARMSVTDASRSVSSAVLRQGTRAAEALTSSPVGRTIAAANERVLAPLARFSADARGALGRAADRANDYFSWGSQFLGRKRVYATGQDLAEQVSLARLQAKRAAAKAYDSIRRSVDDVALIAKNTGIPESRVARIKDHVFNKVHQMGDGLRRFDPSPRIADAWKRLEAGTHVVDDLAFLRHELFESKFEGIFKTNYPTAHAAAELVAAQKVLSRGLAITDPARMLGPGPSLGRLNQLQGQAFENDVLQALRLPKFQSRVTGMTARGPVNTDPDLLIPLRTGVTDIKAVRRLSFSGQLQAQADVADQLGTTFNLIVGPNTRSVSVRLQAAVAARNGIIVRFDPVMGTFRSVRFDPRWPNRMLP